jgi:effector-binding domain-containing protein
MPIKCEILEQQTRPTASIRTKTTVSNLPKTIGEAYAEIGKHLEESGIVCAGAPFAIYYNMDINDLDVEMGFPVAAGIEEKGNIKNSCLPAGKVVSFRHVGPYTELEGAYNEAFAWIKENSIETGGIICEFYLNDPATTPPAELITEINFFLKN